ncbi:hypothetical protein LCGC14_3119840 [marine sediment metagenome]|uniref:Uncharacterized protein n=1 Tax=marine sediment metagenome TaxID=412755 RepID=A0A0F8YSH9_9ZZZZ
MIGPNSNYYKIDCNCTEEKKMEVDHKLNNYLNSYQYEMNMSLLNNLKRPELIPEERFFTYLQDHPFLLYFLVSYYT